MRALTHTHTSLCHAESKNFKEALADGQMIVKLEPGFVKGVYTHPRLCSVAHTDTRTHRRTHACTCARTHTNTRYHRVVNAQIELGNTYPRTHKQNTNTNTNTITNTHTYTYLHTYTYSHMQTHMRVLAHTNTGYHRVANAQIELGEMDEAIKTIRLGLQKDPGACARSRARTRVCVCACVFVRVLCVRECLCVKVCRCVGV